MARNRNKRQLARQQPAAAASFNTRIRQRAEPQQAHGSCKKTQPQNTASLADRMTRDGHIKPQPQLGGEEQAAREQASLRKRKRGETDSGAQQQKRTRVDTKVDSVPESQSAHTESGGQMHVYKDIVQPAATDLKILQNMSDEQKMARRRHRFSNTPVERRILGASKITKPGGGSSAASTRKTQEERKTAGVERALASINDLAKTPGGSHSKYDEGSAFMGQEQSIKKDNEKKSNSTEAVDHPTDQTHDARNDSVIQSSPTSTTNSHQVAEQSIPDTASQDSPSPYKKVTAKRQGTSSTANPTTNAQHTPQDQVVGTQSGTSTSTKQKLQTPCVVINDDRQPIFEPNPEYVLNYQPYDFTSVLLMASFDIAHDEKAEESVDRWYRSNQILNRQAMDMYKRPWTSQYLGRETVNKTLPTRIINDCDLYYRDDQKIYVATEMGLLLVAEYCKAIGVPDEQAVRFEGRKPKWAKKLEADRHYRRVELYHPRNEGSFLQPCISLDLGSIVEVYERCQGVDAAGIAWNFAYGKRTEDGITGFFDYGHTCPMDWGMNSDDEPNAPVPNVIDWGRFDYGPGASNARKYMADLAAGKYAPQSQRRTSAIAKPPVAAASALSLSKASTSSALMGNMALGGVRATAAAPALAAMTGPVTTDPAISNSPANKAQACEPFEPPKAASTMAEGIATAAFEAPTVTANRPIQCKEMLSVAGGPLEDSPNNETKILDTFLNAEELGSSRYDSHEPNTDTDTDNVKDDLKSDMTGQTMSLHVAVASSTSARPITVGTIRRRVGPNEYVEDEIDYDDDEL